MNTVVGILHPGEMGASVGAALVERGAPVVWASAGRSAATVERAAAAGIADVADISSLTARAGLVVSICPPHGARDLALAVAATGFRGIYVDANAVAPATAREICQIVQAAGARFVDGDLIGGPMAPGSKTRLYLSGPDAATVAALLEGSDRGEAVVLGDDPTTASTLKMTYAAWTKGTAALLLAVESAAKAAGVEAHLLAEWQRSQPELAGRLAAAHRSRYKAWRWSGEMDEIARCFRDLGVPDGFASAAAEVFRSVSQD
jgi:3-hydroxyisobutyrate dehydrogenase-like beta-hydroxyacid dehydrogenase